MDDIIELLTEALDSGTVERFPESRITEALRKLETWREYLKITPDPSLHSPQRFRHRKTGTVYRVLGRAVLQTARPLPDDEPLVIYRGADGLWWARSPNEMFDGRFVVLPD